MLCVAALEPSALLLLLSAVGCAACCPAHQHHSSFVCCVWREQPGVPQERSKLFLRCCPSAAAAAVYVQARMTVSGTSGTDRSMGRHTAIATGALCLYCVHDLELLCHAFAFWLVHQALHLFIYFSMYVLLLVCHEHGSRACSRQLVNVHLLWLACVPLPFAEVLNRIPGSKCRLPVSFPLPPLCLPSLHRTTHTQHTSPRTWCLSAGTALRRRGTTVVPQRGTTTITGRLAGGRGTTLCCTAVLLRCAVLLQAFTCCAVPRGMHNWRQQPAVLAQRSTMGMRTSERHSGPCALRKHRQAAAAWLPGCGICRGGPYDGHGMGGDEREREFYRHQQHDRERDGPYHRCAPCVVWC